MLHLLRKLAREIHSRSVWQVLAGYLLLWFAVHQVVDLVEGPLGLPLWTPTFVSVMLGIGLPIVLATTVVQGGLPALEYEDLVDPNELEGLTPAQVLVVPEDHPLHGTGLFTWRNAVLGGVMAAALIVTSVVAYLTMWAFGIGPVGSLVAQGVLEPGDRIVVGAVTNRTDDESLGPMVQRLLVQELSRSTLVTVQAEGDGALVLDGEVAPAAAGLRVVARVRTADGRLLVEFHRDVRSTDRLEEAVARISLRLRQRFGESLREIHEDEDAAATGS